MLLCFPIVNRVFSGGVHYTRFKSVTQVSGLAGGDFCRCLDFWCKIGKLRGALQVWLAV
jgi:hypothetical protein